MDFFAPASRVEIAAIDRVRGWLRATFALDDETTVSITELRCREPGCPPVESVIAIMRPGCSIERHTLAMPTAAISEADVVGLRSG